MSSSQPPSGTEPQAPYESFAAGCLPWIIAIVVCGIVVIALALWAHSAGLT